MKFDTKYNLGDFVYPIYTRRETIKVPTNCKICGDSGKVEIKNKSFICPECKGCVFHTEEGDIEYYVDFYKAGNIGKVEVEIYDKKYRDEDYETKFKYMLDSTGIGSGRVWHQEDLFLTKEEAELECVKRNKERYDSTSKYFIEK